MTTRITNYQDYAERLLPEEFKKIQGGTNKGEQSNIAKEERAFAAQIQELEDALWVMYDKRNINYSESPSNTGRASIVSSVSAPF